jgi:hypothetical protein
MPKSPLVAILHPAGNAPDPQRPLGAAGLALWQSVHREYDVSDIGGREMLCLACQSLDRAESLREQIDADGEVLRGPKNQIRANPALRDEIQARAFVVRTLAKLGLSFEPVRSAPGRPPGAY